jgi:glutamine synthetase
MKNFGGEHAESLKRNTAMGKANIIDRIGDDAGIWQERLDEVTSFIKKEDIRIVRVSFVDVHGILRSRPVEARHFTQVARNGFPTTSAILAMDTANNIVLPVFDQDGGFGRSDMGGAGDMYVVPDLKTFRAVPWAPHSAIVLSNIYLRSGERCPFDPRFIMEKACSALDDNGYYFVGGVEMECTVLKVEDERLSMADCGQPATPPQVSAPQHAYQYFSGDIVDGADDLIAKFREAILGLNLPLRMIEPEWGPGQLEFTLDPLSNMEAADAVIFLRAAIKQVARRNGMIASFMATPGIPNAFSTGWHLHQSLGDKVSGDNVFMDEKYPLSNVGRNFVGGLIEHFAAGAAFSNPTINGYKRLNASPLSPKYATWAHHNKGAMIRLIGEAGDRGTHLENRVGEPAANPYLYMASQIFAGLDGIKRNTDPGDPAEDPRELGKFPMMPIDLVHAIEALDKSEMYAEQFGKDFVSYYSNLSRLSIMRFLSSVTDWEHREYFERF